MFHENLLSLEKGVCVPCRLPSNPVHPDSVSQDMAMDGMSKRLALAGTATGRDKDELLRRSTRCHGCTCALVQEKPDVTAEREAHATRLATEWPGQQLPWAGPQAGFP